MNIAIIPARAKSKRIKDKNIVNFLGRPIIHWSILKAKKSKIFSNIIVTTDSKRISRIAKMSGAETPFLRPRNISDGKTGILKVVKHSIKFLEKKKIKFKYVCCLFPTAPFINKKILKTALLKLKKEKLDFVFGAIQKDSSLLRSFYSKGDKLKMTNSYFYNYESQKLPKIFVDSGQFYWGTKSAWKNKKKIFCNNSGFIELNKDTYIDINSKKDLKKAIKVAKKNFKKLFKVD